jgi:hypothetical protein
VRGYISLIDRPAIIQITEFGSNAWMGSVSTQRPSRSTVKRSPMARISSNRCEM